MFARLSLATFLTAICATSPTCAQRNPLADALIGEGIRFSTGEVVKLPAASMADGLDAKAQQAVIARVAARYPLDQFLRASPVAPFVLKMEPIANARGQRTGQRVDVWFVARGTLAAVRDKRLFEQLIAVGKANERGREAGGGVLTAEQLAARHLAASASADCEETFLRFSVPVLERVQLSGVNRQVVTSAGGSLWAAATLDERFAEDREFRNQWRPLARGDDRSTSTGAGEPYAGSGQYVKVTELVAADGRPTGALFLEAHLAFHEPFGWFAGANLLGSKLPLAIQDNIRTFRRALQQGQPRSQ